MSPVKLADQVASRSGTYRALTPGRTQERQVTMKAALPINNGIMNSHETYSCQPHEDREPAVALESCCPRCKGQLELVQPDLMRCDALLGVCDQCPAWFLIDGRDGTMTDLGLVDRLCASSLLAMSD